MDKENSRSAAGLRRSAVAERIKLREEWSALKGIPESITSNRQPTKTVNKKSQNIKAVSKKTKTKPMINNKVVHVSSDVLRGVVALVDVGAESRALALRAALGALGATVVPTWNPLVTHLIWAQGGCRSTRAKARALASRLVSPLWVEACAASNRRLPEQTFPAAARASDLPSPRTLRRLLKKAEMENIPLVDLLSDSKEDEEPRTNRLRISSETEHDTTGGGQTTDTSHDTTRDTTDIPPRGRLNISSLSAITEESTIISTQSDKMCTPHKNVTDVESRVNTAPRRALPASITPPPAKHSRRKLFTHKEPELHSSDDEDDEQEQTAAVKRVDSKLTQRARRELARAERMARRMAAQPGPAATQPGPAATARPRIALTGMSRLERHAVYEAIRALNGRLQTHISRKTTHVLLGSCREDPDIPCSTVTNHNVTGITSIKTNADVMIPRCDIQKARTSNALAGAARGCRVLHGQWALDSLKANKWLHHHGYEVPHLKKISQKARVERKALGRMRSEYAYDVFSGMRVRLSSSVDQKDAATQLLTLCGAVVIDRNVGFTQNGGLTQNGERIQDGGFDLTLGTGNGEVSSKWVFDSVAAARMRTTRRYVNNTIRNSLETQPTFRCNWNYYLM